MKINREHIAFAAGLFEGEGSIGCYTNESKEQFEKKKYSRGYADKLHSTSIMLTIRMTDREPLELFRETFSVGHLRGPYTNGREDKKPIYAYKVTGFEPVQYIVAQLWSFLSPRRKEQYKKAVTQYLSNRPQKAIPLTRAQYNLQRRVQRWLKDSTWKLDFTQNSEEEPQE